MIGRLPVSLTVSGQAWKIRPNYRDILTIMEAYNDPELSDAEKTWVMLNIVYEDWAQMPQENYEEAAKQAIQIPSYTLSATGRRQRKRLFIKA